MSKPLTKCCKNCKYFDAGTTPKGRAIKATKYTRGSCNVPFDFTVLPSSIITGGKSLMYGVYGYNCPTFSPLETTP